MTPRERYAEYAGGCGNAELESEFLKRFRAGNAPGMVEVCAKEIERRRATVLAEFCLGQGQRLDLKQISYWLRITAPIPLPAYRDAFDRASQDHGSDFPVRPGEVLAAYRKSVRVPYPFASGFQSFGETEPMQELRSGERRLLGAGE